MLGSPDNGVPVLQTPQARWRRVVMPLVIGIAVASLVLLLTAGRGGESAIIGGGSTLAQPLIQRAASDFRAAASADNPEAARQTGGDWVLDGSGIDYEAVGSLGGIMRLDDPEVDFAIADYPLSAAALDDKELNQFPVAVGAVAVVHNLELAEGTQLRLDAPTTAKIFLGTITSWDDAAIAAINPGVTLPRLAITPVHRTDGSGSTLGFTRYLSEGSPEWDSGPGADTRIEWATPKGVDGSGGMVSTVQATQGAIGYVDAGQASRADLNAAAMANSAGQHVPPTAESMGAAVADTDWSATGRYATPLSAPTRATAYPLTVAVYAMVQSDPRSETERERALRFLAYLVTELDTTATELGYLPLPEQAATAVTAHWRSTLDFTP